MTEEKYLTEKDFEEWKINQMKGIQDTFDKIAKDIEKLGVAISEGLDFFGVRIKFIEDTLVDMGVVEHKK